MCLCVLGFSFYHFCVLHLLTIQAEVDVAVVGVTASAILLLLWLMLKTSSQPFGWKLLLLLLLLLTLILLLLLLCRVARVLYKYNSYRISDKKCKNRFSNRKRIISILGDE